MVPNIKRTVITITLLLAAGCTREETPDDRREAAFQAMYTASLAEGTPCDSLSLVDERFNYPLDNVTPRDVLQDRHLQWESRRPALRDACTRYRWPEEEAELLAAIEQAEEKVRNMEAVSAIAAVISAPAPLVAPGGYYGNIAPVHVNNATDFPIRSITFKAAPGSAPDRMDDYELVGPSTLLPGERAIWHTPKDNAYFGAQNPFWATKQPDHRLIVVRVSTPDGITIPSAERGMERASQELQDARELYSSRRSAVAGL